jgi:hypothetical protein
LLCGSQWLIAASEQLRPLFPASCSQETGNREAGFPRVPALSDYSPRNQQVPQALIDYWTGHAKMSSGKDVQKTMNQIYTKMDKETSFREDMAERIGIGFELTKLAVVPGVPRNTVQAEVRNAVESAVK